MSVFKAGAHMWQDLRKGQLALESKPQHKNEYKVNSIELYYSKLLKHATWIWKLTFVHVLKLRVRPSR